MLFQFFELKITKILELFLEFNFCGPSMLVTGTLNHPFLHASQFTLIFIILFQWHTYKYICNSDYSCLWTSVNKPSWNIFKEKPCKFRAITVSSSEYSRNNGFLSLPFCGPCLQCIWRATLSIFFCLNVMVYFWNTPLFPLI